MLENLLKTLVSIGAVGNVVSWISRSLTLWRYYCRESSSNRKWCLRKLLRMLLIDLSYFSKGYYFFFIIEKLTDWIG